MKEQINQILENVSGYRLMRFHNNFYSQKYLELIVQTKDLYKESYKIDIGDVDQQKLFLLSQLYGTNIPEAIHLLYFLRKSINLEGDICEFGVAQGSTSALMANEIINTKKNLWLFDSFEGLPAPTEKDTLQDDIFSLGSMEAYKGKMAYGVESVRKKLKQAKFPFQRVKIIPGFIEETIKSSHLPEKICFAYIDFDFYEPILIALNSLNNKLESGGCLMIDDYGMFSTGAKTAVDEFFEANKTNYEFILPNKSAGHFCMLVKK